MANSSAPISALAMPAETSTDASPCAKCGTADRYKNGRCKACSRAQNSVYAAKNPEKKKAASAAWYAANAERIKALHKEWKKANPEKINAYREKQASCEDAKARHAARIAAWRAANPEKARESNRAWSAANAKKKSLTFSAWAAENQEARRIIHQNRRARKKSTKGKISKGLPAKLFKLQRGMCPCCRQPLGDDYHLDHIMPLALGGTNTDENMQLLRQRCNNQKHAKHPVDFMQQRGFLL